MTIVQVLGAVALTGCLAGPLAGQVSIRVLDSDGRPVPSVRVDVYGRGEIIDVASTSARGIAELSSERWREVSRISLSHIGFQTLIVQADEVPADGVIHLTPEAFAIGGIVVEAGAPCPVVDEPRARALWSAVASRYSPETGFRSWFAYLALYAGAIPETDVHRTPDLESVDYVVAGGPGVIHGGDHTPRSLEERARAEGYAWPPLVVGGTTNSRDLAWAYPQLEREFAYHFATPAFGALHDFAVATESEEQTTLIFCENGTGNGAGINGSISLRPEEAFLAADWHFVTREPIEDAGGSVSFSAYAEGPGQKPHLVASSGYFYRHSGTKSPYPDLPRSYGRWGFTNARWHVNASADRPCNDGISFFWNPPSTPEGIRFADCVASHWGRE